MFGMEKRNLKFKIEKSLKVVGVKLRKKRNAGDISMLGGFDASALNLPGV